MFDLSKEKFEETKELKRNTIVLKAPFLQLQNWFLEKYQTKPINFDYELLPHGRSYRLNIIWETESDKRKFISHSREFETKSKLVLDEFTRLMKLEKNDSFRSTLAIHTHFNFEIIVECNRFISQGEIDSLKSQLSDFNVWEIKKTIASARFFLYTDSQVEECQKSRCIEKFTEDYWSILEKYDEFGYANTLKIKAQLDSKERFETLYGGNWMNYIRNN